MDSFVLLLVFLIILALTLIFCAGKKKGPMKQSLCAGTSVEIEAALTDKTEQNKPSFQLVSLCSETGQPIKQPDVPVDQSHVGELNANVSNVEAKVVSGGHFGDGEYNLNVFGDNAPKTSTPIENVPNPSGIPSITTKSPSQGKTEHKLLETIKRAESAQNHPTHQDVNSYPMQENQAGAIPSNNVTHNYSFITFSTKQKLSAQKNQKDTRVDRDDYNTMQSVNPGALVASKKMPAKSYKKTANATKKRKTKSKSNKANTNPTKGKKRFEKTREVDEKGKKNDDKTNKKTTPKNPVPEDNYVTMGGIKSKMVDSKIKAK